MLSSNNRAASLSIVSVLLLLAGCPDPQGRFDEFVKKVPDSPIAVVIDAPKLDTIPDISGTFLYSIFVALFSTTPPVQAIATVTVDKTVTPPKASFTIQFLTANAERVLTGTPTTYSDIPIDETGAFTVNVPSLVVPVEASPIGIQATATGVVLGGTIKTADFFCGTVAGMIQPQNQPLGDSRFGAIRVQPGQTGAQLPKAIDMCSEPAPDAGP